MTASADKTAIIWSAGEEGEEPQVLEGSLSVIKGHEDEIFSCAFNYEGDTIITGSKDNTCKIWLDNEKFFEQKKH
jgi:dynein assembly factor with WDR repeat domains 1